MIADSVQVRKEEVNVKQYDRDDGIVGLMDRGGSNLAKINEQFKEATGDAIVRVIATTQASHPECNARNRAKEFGVPLVDEVDFLRYEQEKGVKPGDYYWALQGPKHVWRIKSKIHPDKIIEIRNDVCKLLVEKLYAVMEKEGIKATIPQFAAGCMSLLSGEYVKAHDVLNIHPGDLTKYSLDGMAQDKRCIVGDGWKPSALAILSGHETLYSSMHVMIPEMDAGPVRMRGYGLPIDYNQLLTTAAIQLPSVLKKVGSAAQEALKYLGDHVIAGATFWDMFQGNWGTHATGIPAYKYKDMWFLAPNGIMIEDHVLNNSRTPFKRDQLFIDNKIEEFYSKIEKI